jgi:PHD/YefM family antitoxin component YafN of YafNO toxin-antitoxin module
MENPLEGWEQPLIPEEDVVAISEADLLALSDEIRRTERPKVITRDGAADLVVLSVAGYEDLVEGLEVARGLLRGEADVAAGRVHTHEEAMAYFRAGLDAARKARKEQLRAG